MKCWRREPSPSWFWAGRPEAVADADEAQRLRPQPAHERLRQRALLARPSAQSLQLDRPEDVLLFPVGGRRLTADLRGAAETLQGRPQKLGVARPSAAFLNRAVILAALGRRAEAEAAATTPARGVATVSPRYLIRARILAFAGDRARRTGKTSSEG